MINVLEEAVANTYSDLRSREPQFCACAHCQDDVVTMALNKIRPRYVTAMSLGAAVTRVAMEQDAARAEVAVIVFDAMRRVAASPRHTS